MNIDVPTVSLKVSCDYDRNINYDSPKDYVSVEMNIPPIIWLVDLILRSFNKIKCKNSLIITMLVKSKG